MSIEIKKKYDQTKKIALDFKGQLSKTKQSFHDETNINKIMERYNKTGILPNLIKQNPKYGDFTEASTYQESLNTVLFAQEQFNALSAKIRNRFHNDPTELLKFVSDAKNLEEMYELGMAIRPAENEPSNALDSQTSEAGNNQAPGTGAQPAAKKGK